MITRKEALQQLLAKVEAGAGIEYASYRKAFDGIDRRPPEMEYPILRDQARLAFLGSLDAAKALHDAVLPGWHWSVYDTDGIGSANTQVEPPEYSSEPFDGVSPNPARAWLIAIIKALIAQEPT